jgi:hypothetical protein
MSCGQPLVYHLPSNRTKPYEETRLASLSLSTCSAFLLQVSQNGHLHHEKEIRQKQIQRLVGMRDKYDIKVTEVLDDGTIKEN